MKTNGRKPTHKQVLQELMKRPRVPAEIRERHGDIEDAIAEAGGTRGGMKCAEA
jgi:hypothetical protein